MEDSGDEEEASIENQSSVILVEYSGIIRGSYLMRSVHIMLLASIMLKISLS